MFQKLLALIGVGGFAYFLFGKPGARTAATTLVKGKTYDAVFAVQPKKSIQLSDMTEALLEFRDAFNRMGFVPNSEPKPYGPEDMGRFMTQQVSYWTVRGTWVKDEPYITSVPDAFKNAMFYPVT